MAWKSFSPHPMELLGDMGQMEACFSLFGDNVNLDMRQVPVCAKRAIGLEIILGTIDRTPR
jgi:hypothetical protein